MTWISVIRPGEADGRLKNIYNRISAALGRIENILMAHSLRPHTMEAHMALYRASLHHPGNSVDRTILEILSVYTSILNGCRYCTEHHFVALSTLLKDDDRALQIRAALEAGTPETALEGKALAAALYSEKLTRSPRIVAQADIEALRDVGFTDGEILEINQAIAYFAYANRTVLGLGINTDGEILGLNPSAEEVMAEN